MHVWTNWAGNIRAIPARLTRPTNLDSVVEAIRSARTDGLTVKAVGGSHSFAPAAATTGVRLDMDAMAEGLALDLKRRLVTVQGGMSLQGLNRVLAVHGLALPNLPNFDQQTISGALATGTHGTGNGLHGVGLASHLEEVELVTAAGEVRRTRDGTADDVFEVARLGLGAIGVVTEVTLRCVESFTLRAEERTIAVDRLMRTIDELVHDNEYVEFQWFPYTERARLTLRNATAESARPRPRLRRWLVDDLLIDRVYQAACRLGQWHPPLQPTISRISSGVLPPMRYTGPSHEVLQSAWDGRFVAMEYAVPRPALGELLAGVRSIIDQLPVKVALPVKIRFSAGDDVWLSPAYERETAHVMVTQYVGAGYNAAAGYEEYFRRVESLATALDGRPHWGMLHWRDAASLAAAYPRFSQVLAVRDKLDPGRLFTNAYLERVLGP